MEIKYYECHITIEPVFDERLQEFTKICATERFKPAKLLMQKREQDTAERSSKDTFATAHSKDYQDIHDRMMRVVTQAALSGFAVWRYKIEAVVLDERVKRAC